MTDEVLDRLHLAQIFRLDAEFDEQRQPVEGVHPEAVEAIAG